LDTLFRQHYAYLCKVVFRVLPDAAMAEDLVQEVFYEVWRKRDLANDKNQPPQSISTGQYYALLNYQSLHNDHLKAICAPGAYYEGTGTGTADEDATAKWSRNVNSRYESARKAIQDRQNNYQGDLWAALDMCVIQGQQMPHMIGDLRTLGNTLSNHFGGIAR
jgi:hypothetical protein